MSFRLRQRHLPALDAELTKINKVAAKLGVEPMAVEILSTETVEVRVSTWNGSELIEETWCEIEVHGSTPVLPGGWSFLGAIEHLKDGGANLLHGDAPELEAFRTAAPDCSHCGHKRNRRKTVVLRSEAGDIVQVGSTCLKDFLGYHGNPERVAWMVEMIKELGEDADREDFGGRYSRPEAPTLLFMAASAASVRINGWVAKSYDPSIATALVAAQVIGASTFTPSPKQDAALIERIERVEITDADREEAAKVIEWAAQLDSPTDYLGNVQAVLAHEWIEAQHFGIAASAVSARQKELGMIEARKAKEEAAKSSRWIGEEGQRLEMVVTVNFKREIPSDYGSKFLVSMATADGNTVKTFSSGAFGWDAEVGETYRIKGTVKEHELWNGSQETMMTRVAFVATEKIEQTETAADDNPTNEEPQEAAEMTIEVFVPDRIVAEYQTRNVGAGEGGKYKVYDRIRELEKGAKVKMNKTEAKEVLADCESYVESGGPGDSLDSATKKRYRVLRDKLRAELN